MGQYLDFDYTGNVICISLSTEKKKKIRLLYQIPVYQMGILMVTGDTILVV